MQPIARAQSNQCRDLNATSVFGMRKRDHWTRRGLASQSVRPELKVLTLGRFTSWRDYYRVTLVLFRTRRRDECSRLKEGVRRRVRKSRQKEAAGAADAGLMQIEWSEGGV